MWLQGPSGFPVHTGIQSWTHPITTWPGTFTLKLQGNWHPCISRTPRTGTPSAGNRRQKPAGLLTPCLQQLPWLLEASTCQTATELLLPTGLAPWCLQQLLLLLEAQASAQVDSGNLLPCGHQTTQALWHQALLWESPCFPVKKKRPRSSTEW
jgi:hypothetical protein